MGTIIRRLLLLTLLTVCLAALLTIPALGAGRNVTITLDPGHGKGSTGGGEEWHDGVHSTETDLVWRISCYLRDYLTENYTDVTVLLSREADTNPTLWQRAETAKNLGSELLLSIHLNGYNRSLRGATAFVAYGNYDKKTAAITKEVGTALLRELEALGVKNRGNEEHLTSYIRYPDGSRADSYDLVRFGIRLGMPALILEECFLDTYEDWRDFLSSEEKLRAMAEANGRALAEYYHLTPRPRSSLELGEGPYADVLENTWYYGAALWSRTAGLLQGMEPAVFGPEVAVNRAMTAAVLQRLALQDGTEDREPILPPAPAAEPETPETPTEPETPETPADPTEEPETPEETSEDPQPSNPSSEETDPASSEGYTDVAPGRWFHASVTWASGKGLAYGFPEGDFRPEEPVTREQLAVFLYRYSLFAGEEETAPGDLTRFTDADSVSAYAREAVAWALGRGILSGFEDGTLRPQAGATRAQLASILRRYRGKS